MKRILSLIFISAVSLPLVAQQNPVLPYTQNMQIGTIPTVTGFSGNGIPVLGHGNLSDDGDELLYKGQPLSGGGGGTVDQTARNAAAAAQTTANNALPKAGGTVTGAIILAADPTVALGAATKQYVDAHAGSGSANATSIQGVSVSPTAPTTGQALIYNGSSYVPTTPSGGGSTPIATTSAVGTVKPDGTTISVQADGTVAVTGALGSTPVTTTGAISGGTVNAGSGGYKLNNTSVHTINVASVAVTLTNQPATFPVSASTVLAGVTGTSPCWVFPQDQASAVDVQKFGAFYTATSGHVTVTVMQPSSDTTAQTDHFTVACAL